MTAPDGKSSADLLADFPLLSGLPKDARAALAERMHIRHWSAGTILFQRGDPGDHLIAVTSGLIRVQLTTPQGRQVILRQFETGDILGEIAIIDGDPRSAEAVAVSDAAGLILPRAHFLSVARRMPVLYEVLARYFCRLLRDTNFQIESIALYDLQARLVRFLLFSLEQQSGGDTPAFMELHLKVNQTDLSAFLGASRPKVNQAMQALLALGVVQRKGDALICDLAGLRALSEPE
ncbi:Crp/Fnr family transcriptional regulator [Paracoccus zhejiangensis]|uniref:Crp/Fnr family transcriptional regulator n=1 Tax=Paracoccus zhejiangensis TaxID=1077935 RepID=A0A2H5EU46_9RHOB|nr:Crp/Fnr family transcriptional regulator [Paracoccus zhejiangensis]AUH62821.1 Crp/Fnr family transcriptional regulator [Paracoccus zhejiangensis]